MKFDHLKLIPPILRAAADEAESITSAKYWPYPTYSELLYGVG